MKSGHNLLPLGNLKRKGKIGAYIFHCGCCMSSGNLKRLQELSRSQTKIEIRKALTGKIE